MKSLLYWAASVVMVLLLLFVIGGAMYGSVHLLSAAHSHMLTTCATYLGGAFGFVSVFVIIVMFSAIIKDALFEG